MIIVFLPFIENRVQHMQIVSGNSLDELSIIILSE